MKVAKPTSLTFVVSVTNINQQVLVPSKLIPHDDTRLTDSRDHNMCVGNHRRVLPEVDTAQFDTFNQKPAADLLTKIPFAADNADFNSVQRRLGPTASNEWLYEAHNGIGYGAEIESFRTTAVQVQIFQCTTPEDMLRIERPLNDAESSAAIKSAQGLGRSVLAVAAYRASKSGCQKHPLLLTSRNEGFRCAVRPRLGNEDEDLELSKTILMQAQFPNAF